MDLPRGRPFLPNIQLELPLPFSSSPVTVFPSLLTTSTDILACFPLESPRLTTHQHCCFSLPPCSHRAFGSWKQGPPASAPHLQGRPCTQLRKQSLALARKSPRPCPALLCRPLLPCFLISPSFLMAPRAQLSLQQAERVPAQGHCLCFSLPGPCPPSPHPLAPLDPSPQSDS